MQQEIETIQPVETGSLALRKPFTAIFPIQDETLAAIRQDMETNGFDPVFPIIVWKEENVVVDGHTRFAAARELELDTVPVVLKSFDNEDDAILYSFHVQRNRRNMSDDDILKCLALLDNIHGNAEKGSDDDPSRQTRKAVNESRAKELGISTSKVDKARKVLEHGDQEIRQKVESGEKSINQAFNEVQEMRRESGEIKGRATDGLGGAARYTQTLGRFLKELTRIKEQGWEDVSMEKVLADIESIRELVES